MKKGSIVRYLLSSACALSLIGTGFALWIFDDSYVAPEGKLQLNGEVTAACEEGNLIVLRPLGYTTFNLVLEQANGVFSTHDANGVRFVPYFDIEYKDFIYHEDINVKFKAEVIFNNQNLDDYIDVVNSTYDEVNNSYIFIDEFIDLSSVTKYTRTINPRFEYNPDKMPVSAKNFSDMIGNICAYNDNLEYDFTILVSVQFVHKS